MAESSKRQYNVKKREAYSIERGDNNQVKEIYKTIKTNSTVIKCINGEVPTNDEVKSLEIILGLCLRGCPTEFCNLIKFTLMTESNMSNMDSSLKNISCEHLSLCFKNGLLLTKILGVQNIRIDINHFNNEVSIKNYNKNNHGKNTKRENNNDMKKLIEELKHINTSPEPVEMVVTADPKPEPVVHADLPPEPVMIKPVEQKKESWADQAGGEDD
jgi:hypothetical protein